MTDPLCVCGHSRDNHPDPASGDTRCLAVEDRRDLLAVFDDGRDIAYADCACLRSPPRPGPGIAMTLTATRTSGTGLSRHGPALQQLCKDSAAGAHTRRLVRDDRWDERDPADHPPR